MTLENAVQFAASLHSGQVYRGYGGREDEPYILHLLRVMLAVSPHARIAAVLHDAKEDHGDLPDWLSDTDYDAVCLLTRMSRADYDEYIALINAAEGEAADIAREVKIADLRDNLSNNPPDRLRERYEWALTRLVFRLTGAPHRLAQ